MKISFPRMGYSYLAFKWLVENLGHECIVPPEPNKTTLDLGVRHSPEFACIPFKILMGTYLQVAEMGAEVILTSGGIGPCRAGYYWVMHQKILEDMGLPVKIIGFEPPLRDIWDFIRKINFIKKSARVSWRQLSRVVKVGWEKLKILDELEKLSFEIRPRQLRRGDTTRALDEALRLVDEANDLPQLEKAYLAAIDILKSVDQDFSRNPLKVGIVGEIYVLIEPSANHYVQSTLGEMGVYTDRSMYITGYTQHEIDKKTIADILEAAHPYLSEECIGGHGVHSVGETVLYARNGFDGVIQLAPFSCIPEIVAKGILPRVSREIDIPVMTLFIDEQTGKSGVETRLEAFVDLMERRREYCLRNKKVPSLLRDENSIVSSPVYPQGTLKDAGLSRVKQG